MARPIATTVGEIKKPVGLMRGDPMQEDTLAEGRINLGMITTIDPADIPNGALQGAKNCRVRYDRTSRRFGTSLITPVKPNANIVLNTFYVKKNDASENTLRFTKNSIHKRGVGWTAFTAGVGGSLLGGDTDYFRGVVAFDRFFFTNNGVDEIQEADVVGNTYLKLSTSAGISTKYRYITAFYNRIVAANLQGASPNPVQVGWSAEGGITGTNLNIWDPAVDDSAGAGPLVDSPTDLSDFISGIFGLTNIMFVLRNQSIWLATKNPVASNPFNFYSAFPGIGCDCPQSARVAINAICWVDTRTKAVWAYAPNSQPERIGFNIEKDVIKSIDDPAKVFGGFDPVELEYYIGIPLAASNITRLWIYSFKSKTWVYDEVEGISSIIVAPLGAGTLAIDELSGTIDNQVGTIDSLIPTGGQSQARLYGRFDGEITEEDGSVSTDPSYAASSGQYTTDIISKDFENKAVDSTFSKIRFEMIPQVTGTVSLYYMKNNSGVWTLAKTKTFGAGDIGKSVIFKLSKQIKARRLTWKLSTTDAFFDLTEYEIKIYPSGESRS